MVAQLRQDRFEHVCDVWVGGLCFVGFFGGKFDESPMLVDETALNACS